MYYLHDLILYYFTNFELLLWGSRVGFSLIFSIDHLFGFLCLFYSHFYQILFWASFLKGKYGVLETVNVVFLKLCTILYSVF